MPPLEFATRAVERKQPVHFKGGKIAARKDNARFTLRIEMEEVLRETVIARRKRARRQPRFHPRARFRDCAGGFALDAGAHKVLLEDLFEGHAHAFIVADNINHFSSLMLGWAGENSRSAAATL